MRPTLVLPTESSETAEARNRARVIPLVRCFAKAAPGTIRTHREAAFVEDWIDPDAARRQLLGDCAAELPKCRLGRTIDPRRRKPASCRPRLTELLNSRRTTNLNSLGRDSKTRDGYFSTSSARPVQNQRRGRRVRRYERSGRYPASTSSSASVVRLGHSYVAEAWNVPNDKHSLINSATAPARRFGLSEVRTPVGEQHWLTAQ